MAYNTIIGLEVHVELNTESKMFCSCSAKHFQIPPNTHTCPTCLGLPGALPTVNKEACERCIKIGLALGCEILDRAVFARKHYAYPDLAKGYQISQYELPFCINGKINILGREIRIKRVHMEEDTGKLQHNEYRGELASFVDFNRSGVPLVEIVTEPDFRSIEEVEEYARTLQRLMRYLRVSTADMEKGSMRFEANISLMKTDQKIPEKLKAEKLPKYKVEVKNLNSFKAVTSAITYEVKRQQELLEEGKIPSQETRGWDDARQITYPQREKEDAHDYRYFPDPDIAIMQWMKQRAKELKKQLPELPWQKKERYTTHYGLNEYDATVITDNINVAEWFDEGLRLLDQSATDTNTKKAKAKKLANMLLGEIFALRNNAGEDAEEIEISVHEVITVNEAVESGVLSTTNAKVVIAELYGKANRNKTAESIIKEKNLKQVNDATIIETAVKKVVEEQSKAVTDYKKGKKTAIMFLIGQVMKELKGRGDTNNIKELLEKYLN